MILDLADRADDLVARVAVLADACGGRRTTADRLRRRLGETTRVGHRRELERILDDVAEGSCSVLEHGYLTLVERPHGLPTGRRQSPATGADGRRMLRDVLHAGRSPRWRLVVELDGRLFHASARARDADLERDLDAAVDREETVRLGYGQVFVRACLTAARIAQIMKRLGWRGQMRRCPDCPS